MKKLLRLRYFSSLYVPWELVLEIGIFEKKLLQIIPVVNNEKIKRN